MRDSTQTSASKRARYSSGGEGRAVDGRTLYVNTTGEEKIVPIRGTRHGVVSGATYERAIRLRPYYVDVVEQEPVHSP